ncbi:hypothetical protein [Algoriphagus taiwanensis]|uniref:Uncharacterized protein n=1 Tax=Algoriphagus taiwanensis TaxID=1445656 RepID=A0ABQ6Q076_9BACT|nr:hypothetical protein Ataiwa_18760 [Algoriphagus taiwanensis]
MKLSPDQITTLKKLISFKGYEEVDVQYEILDHVACRIEVLLEENPKLSLDDAFRKTHAEFGIFGFADLADSYRESIRKKFWNRYWASLKSLLTSYRVIYLILLAWIFHLISQNFTLFGEKLTAPGWAVIGLMISMVFFLIYFHRVGKNFKNYATFKHGLNFFGGFNLIIQISVQGMRFLRGPEIPMELNFQGIMAWITISALLISWVSLFLLPQIIQEAADETQRLKAIYEA